MIEVRSEFERGKADHGWLNSSHTFSFASYYDPKHTGFGSLRVINEDRVVGGAGFPPHPHKDMEILTFVLKGALAHKDSMGNESVIKPGEIQLMSAGSGVVHSEYNNHQEEEVHFYQIWIETNRPGAKPRYQQSTYKHPKNELKLLITPEGVEGAEVKIYQESHVFLGQLDRDHSLDLPNKEGSQYWLQLIKGEIKIGDNLIQSGDGVAITGGKSHSLRASNDSEFLLFELKTQE